MILVVLIRKKRAIIASCSTFAPCQLFGPRRLPAGSPSTSAQAVARVSSTAAMRARSRPYGLDVNVSDGEFAFFISCQARDREERKKEYAECRDDNVSGDGAESCIVHSLKERTHEVST